MGGFAMILMDPGQHLSSVSPSDTVMLMLEWLLPRVTTLTMTMDLKLILVMELN